MQTKNYNIHTKKKKQPKHNTKDGHQATREKNKRGREDKRLTETNPKQLTKQQWEHTYQSLL